MQDIFYRNLLYNDVMFSPRHLGRGGGGITTLQGRRHEVLIVGSDS